MYNDMTIDLLVDVFESIRLENKAILKMKIVNDAMLDKRINQDLELLLSILYHGLLACPKPKWKNALSPKQGQLIAEAKRLLTTSSIDTKEFHELPLKVQAVLYHCSTRSDIGLNTSQLASAINVIPKDTIYWMLGITSSTSISNTENACPMCGGAKVDTQDILCEECFEKVVLATEYTSESFNVYGVSVKDFELSFLDWTLSVTNGLFNYKRELTSIERYEPLLPFEEYRKTLQLI